MSNINKESKKTRNLILTGIILVGLSFFLVSSFSNYWIIIGGIIFWFGGLFIWLGIMNISADKKFKEFKLQRKKSEME